MNKKIILFLILLSVTFYILPLTTLAQGTSFANLAGQSFGTTFGAITNPIGTLTNAVSGLFGGSSEGSGSIISSITWGVILWLVNLLVAFISAGLNLIIFITITHFETFINDLKVIEIGWTISRDIANMFFIFILLYVAIGTILQLSNIDTKKTLVNIIIVALLINFSATFTKVAIDASNITALTFYNLTSDEPNKVNISRLFQNSISFFQKQNPLLPEEFTQQSTNSFLADFMLGIFSNTGFGKDTGILVKNLGILSLMLLIMVIFVIIAIMFLVRALSLIVLLITAPLALLGTIFSPLKEIYTMWISRLKCDILFPPIFMFFLYITFAIFENIFPADKPNSIGVLAGVPRSIVSEIIILFMLNGLLVCGLIISQRACKTDFGFNKDWLKKKATGVTGFFGRETIGRAGKALSESKTLQKGLAKNVFTRFVSDKVANVGTRAANAGFGSGTGYLSSLRDRQQKQRSMYDRVEDPVLKARLVTNLLMKQDREALYKNLNATDRAKLETETQNSKNVSEDEKKLILNELNRLKKEIPQKEKEATDTELGQLLAKQIRFQTDPNTNKLTNKVSDLIDQLKKINEFKEKGQLKLAYKNLSDTDKILLEKKALIEAEKADNTVEDRRIAKDAADAMKNLREELAQDNSEQGQKLEELAEKADIRAEKQLEETRAREIKNKVFDYIKTSNTSGVNNVEIMAMFKDLLKTLSIKQVAELPKTVLLRPEVAKIIGGNTLAAINKKESMSDSDLTDLLKMVTELQDEGSTGKIYAEATLHPSRQTNAKSNNRPPIMNNNLNNDSQRPDEN